MIADINAYVKIWSKYFEAIIINQGTSDKHESMYESSHKLENIMKAFSELCVIGRVVWNFKYYCTN